MHKGSGPVQRKRKPHNQSPNEQCKKRRVIRNGSEVQSGPGLREGVVPSKCTVTAWAVMSFAVKLECYCTCQMVLPYLLTFACLYRADRKAAAGFSHGREQEGGCSLTSKGSAG